MSQLDNSTTILVDDRDPSIVYSPAAVWDEQGLSGVEQDGTTHGTGVVGAAFQFMFSGEQIL